MNSTAGAAPGAHDGGLDGASILLELLGGLMLAGLVGAWSSFVQILVKPFEVGYLGQHVVANSYAWVLACVAFFGYLLNVFRQVHGLALVCTDRKYRAEVDQFLDYRHRMAALFGLLLVLSVPALLASVVSSADSYAWLRSAVLRSSANDQKVAAAFGPGLICAAYLVTMLFYVVWDLVVFRVLERTDPSATSTTVPSVGWLPDQSASDYRTYVANWLTLCMLFGSPMVLLLAVAVLLTVTGFAQPSEVFGISWVYVLMLATLTLGYSACDYYFNRRFYFG